MLFAVFVCRAWCAVCWCIQLDAYDSSLCGMRPHFPWCFNLSYFRSKSSFIVLDLPKLRVAISYKIWFSCLFLWTRCVMFLNLSFWGVDLLRSPISVLFLLLFVARNNLGWDHMPIRLVSSNLLLLCRSVDHCRSWSAVYCFFYGMLLGHELFNIFYFK